MQRDYCSTKKNTNHKTNKQKTQPVSQVVTVPHTLHNNLDSKHKTAVDSVSSQAESYEGWRLSLEQEHLRSRRVNLMLHKTLMTNWRCFFRQQILTWKKPKEYKIEYTSNPKSLLEKVIANEILRHLYVKFHTQTNYLQTCCFELENNKPEKTAVLWNHSLERLL